MRAFLEIGIAMLNCLYHRSLPFIRFKNWWFCFENIWMEVEQIHLWISFLCLCVQFIAHLSCRWSFVINKIRILYSSKWYWILMDIDQQLCIIISSLISIIITITSFLCPRLRFCFFCVVPECISFPFYYFQGITIWYAPCSLLGLVPMNMALSA